MRLTPSEKAAYESEAAQLREILSAGASEVSVDGQRVTYDLNACRQRLQHITQLLHPSRRPRVSSINLGGF
jgi:hypothetical protein